MKLTSSLFIRNFLASIHPPLSPQSPRESKHLLNVLEAAFKKHLDETHPSPKEYHSPNSVPDPAQRAAHSTHTHLDTILSHPLLGHPLPNQHHRQHVQTPRLATQAIQRYDRALASNTLDLHLVRECAVKYLLDPEEKVHITNEAKLGPRLARYFNSMTGLQKKNVLLTEKESLEAMVSVMYADGLEAEVWQWLRILYERSFGLDDDFHLHSSLYWKAEDLLVSMMIKETVYRIGLADAAQHYLKAWEYRNARSEGLRPGQSPKPLPWSWRRIVIPLLWRRSNHGLPPDLYDSLLNHGLDIAYCPVPISILRLYHPTCPSTVPLSQSLLGDLNFRNDFIRWQTKPNFKWMRRHFFIAILDAAQLALDHNVHHARAFLDFVESAYADLLPPRVDEVDTLERIKATRDNFLAKKEMRPTARFVPLPLVRKVEYGPV